MRLNHIENCWITGTGLAKVCRKANIPVPPRGYWNKLQYGKPVIKRPPLPPATNGAGETLTIQPSSPAGGADPVVDARAAEEQKPENRIEVSDQLRRPHPLVQATNAALAKSRSGEHAVPAAGSVASKTEAILDIRVSPATRHRALRLVDALLKALEARGYQVSARGVTIEGQLVPIGVTEKDDRALHVPTAAERAEKQRYPWTRIPTWDYAPNGQLSIHADAYVWWRKDLRKRWSDSRSVHLEDKLNDVVVGLVALGAALGQRADEQRREADARAEQERLRQERARRARMEKARRDHLVASTESWTTAERIRQLVAAVERRATAGEGGIPADLAAWTSWAKQVADDLDPLGAGIDALLRRQEEAAETASQSSPYGM
ncbi:MAG TPA: hypothetical protein VMB34_21410 [Acetobacteraceae bacterium]|nr:hypothetical protein [Acetobacteraceae bacterium]